MGASEVHLSYSNGATAVPLIEKTIGRLFDEVCSTYEHNDALVSKHQALRYTYGELRNRVDEVAFSLLSLGVKKGDRVGIWSPNNAEWVLTQFATAKVGAVLVNINPAYRVPELEYALNQSGVSLLITAKQFKTSDYHSMIYELALELKEQHGKMDSEVHASRIPTLHRIVTLDNSNDASHPGMLSWDGFIEEGKRASTAELRERELSLAFMDPINIQYTSGTTAYPKGATLTHYGILNNGFFVGEEMKFTSKDRLCIPVPFYHCFGMVLGNLANSV